MRIGRVRRAMRSPTASCHARGGNGAPSRGSLPVDRSNTVAMGSGLDRPRFACFLDGPLPDIDPILLFLQQGRPAQTFRTEAFGNPTRDPVDRPTPFVDRLGKETRARFFGAQAADRYARQANGATELEPRQQLTGDLEDAVGVSYGLVKRRASRLDAEVGVLHLHHHHPPEKLFLA